MSALFFGPAGAPLFGYHHEPRGAARGAALICPSWGSEYQYAYRALQVLARRLAEHGFHVLRFDYTGTGDSWGDTTDANMVRWREDIAAAARELQALSGQRRLDLVGLRIGAALAASASALLGARRLVLWDPVLDGSGWVAGFEPPTPAPAGAGASPGAAVEFAQYLVSGELPNQLAAIGSEHYRAAAAETVLLLRTQTDEPDPAADAFPAVPGLQREFVADVPPWLEDTSIWSGQVPARAVRRIVEWLAA